MCTVLLLVLGVSSTVFAEKCKNIKPQDNFDPKMFAGVWYLTGNEISNPKDSAKYSEIRCAIFNFHEENNPKNWTLDFYVRDKQLLLSGGYTMPDPTKGHLKLELAKRNLIYNYIIKCTDYVTYSVNYVCLDIGPEESSEFMTIVTRDTNSYDEIIANPEIKKCFAELTSTPIEETLVTVSFDNCPNMH